MVGITGEPGRAPVRVGYSMGDMGGSLFGVIGILAALSEREKSGQGQWLDVSMVDAQVALCENACARYFATGQNPGPLGSRHPLFTPFQIFPTRDGHIVLIVMRDEQWKGFCEAADRPEWITDDRFNSNNARLENYDLFLEHMNELMGARTTKDWMERFDARGVMCGPVNTIEDVVNDPHIQARGMFPEVEHPRLGPLKVVGTPMKFSRTPLCHRPGRTRSGRAHGRGAGGSVGPVRRGNSGATRGRDHLTRLGVNGTGVCTPPGRYKTSGCPCPR